MNVFVDTSALLAVLDADEQDHELARQTWVDLISQKARLICTNYVLLETFALVQRRLGIPAVRALQEDVVPILHIEWIGIEQHAEGVNALLIAANRALSLVDCTSFAAMRRLSIQTAFALDVHFQEQGFVCVPMS